MKPPFADYYKPLPKSARLARKIEALDHRSFLNWLEGPRWIDGSGISRRDMYGAQVSFTYKYDARVSCS